MKTIPGFRTWLRRLTPSRWRLGVAVALASVSLATAAEPADDFNQAMNLWKNKQYLEALQVLKEYRQGPYGKTPEVDYMIASSMCRLPGYESKGQQYFQWLLYNHRLDDGSRKQVLEEMRNCASSQTPVIINFVVVRSGAGARVGGKMFYSVRSEQMPLSSVPVKVLREIPASEMAQRLFPLSDPMGAIRKAKALLGPGSVAETHGHFLLARKADSDSESGPRRAGSLREQLQSSGALAAFGKQLEQYLAFFAREFKMQTPTNFITVYCHSDSTAVQETAEALHGIRVSPLSIGYSFRDDLSLVGLFDGTLYHELFHLLVYNNFGDIPPWLDEGIAALYEVSRLRDGEVEGLPNWRGDVLREFRNNRPTLDKLIRMDWRSFDDETGESRSATQAANHAMARYFMLMLQERRQLAAVYQAFRNREVESTQGDPAAEAVRLVERTTGKTIAELDKEFDTWFEGTFSQRSNERHVETVLSDNAPPEQNNLRNLNRRAVNAANNAPAPTSNPIIPKVSEDEIRRSVKVRASRGEQVIDTLPNGRVRRHYSIWIEAPAETLAEIAKVQYRFDPTKFNPSNPQIATPGNGFMYTYLGIGAVNADMDIDLVLHDGRRASLKFNVYQALFVR